MADTWLTPEQKEDLLSYIKQGASKEDLYAAGYDDDDLFEVGYFKQPSVEPFVANEKDSLQAYEPTQRENYRVGIQEKLKGVGLDEALSADIAEGVTGNTNPTDGSLGIGLMDFTPFSASFGIQEGYRTAKRGWENSDPLTTGLGAAEAALGVAESLPAVGVAVKGARRAADAMVDAYDPTVMNALLGRSVPMYKEKQPAEPSAPATSSALEEPRIKKELADYSLTAVMDTEAGTRAASQYDRNSLVYAPNISLDQLARIANGKMSAEEVLDNYGMDPTPTLIDYIRDSIMELQTDPRFVEYQGALLDNPDFDPWSLHVDDLIDQPDYNNDLIEFQSPIPEALEAVYDNVFLGKQGKTIKGSQLIKEIQDNASIRKSEWDSLDIEIDKTKEYTGPEILEMAEVAKSRWSVTTQNTGNKFGGYQRQDVVDPQLDYYEMPVNAKTTGKSFKARSQHFENETLSHARASLRQDVYTGQKYILVEELQSDLLQQGYIKPDKDVKFDPKSFSKFFRTYRGQLYDNIARYTGKDPDDIDQSLWEYASAERALKKTHQELRDFRRNPKEVKNGIETLYETTRKNFYPKAPPYNEVKDDVVKKYANYGIDSVTEFVWEGHAKAGGTSAAPSKVDSNAIDSEFETLADLEENADDNLDEALLNLTFRPEDSPQNPTSAWMNAPSINFELSTAASNFKRFENEVKQLSESSLPPIRKTEEGVRLSIQALMGKADQEGVDKIVIPPFERIVEKRFTKGSAEYQNALDEKSGFYATYIKSLNKVLGELQKEFGEGVKISQRPLEYQGQKKNFVEPMSEQEIEELSFFLADFMNTLQMEQRGYDLYERFDPDNTLWDEFRGQGTPEERTHFLRLSNRSRMADARSGPRGPQDIGVEIDISGIREKYDLTKPRFAQGGMVESNMIDPVSKNPVPPGATPKEVRDDVDIKASEGEYVLPADVVRYLGLDKIERLVESAKKGIAKMQENGRIGGSRPGDEELPFDPSELQAIEDMPPPDSSPGVVPGMAAGGMVASPTQNLQRFSQYQPRSPYDPKSFIPRSPTVPSFTQNEGRSDEEREAMRPTGLAGNPDQWSLNDFSNFVDNRGSGPNRIIEQGIKSVMPFGGLALEARNRYLDKAVPERINEMLKTGVDSKGNKITDDQRQRLNQSLERLTKEERPESGFGKSGLLGGLFDMALDKFMPKDNPAEKAKKDAKEAEEKAKKDAKDKARESSGTKTTRDDRDDKDESPRSSSRSSSSSSKSGSGGSSKSSSGKTSGDRGNNKNAFYKGGLVSRRK